METAASVITDALVELVVQTAEAPIQADEAQTAIRYMNRMMASYAIEGINLGYTRVTNLGDTITVPDGALDGMVFNLAIRLAKQYDATVSQTLYDNAREGKKAMYKLAVNIIPTQYPSTLPVGSGNEQDGYSEYHFYNESDEAVLTEQGSFISTESETLAP